MHAFRSALTTCQRQLTAGSGQRAFAVAATATVPVLSAQEWMDNIKKSAEKDVLIKKTKLASFLKTVTTSEELEASKEIMKIYEQKRVDPDSNAAGLFVKKALELNAANVVFEVLEANYRIGLFLEPTTLNKLLSKFFKDGDFEKVFQLHEIGSQKYHVKSTERTYDILIRAAIEQEDLEKAVALLKTAAESHKLQRVTCNNLLFKLKEGEQAEKQNTPPISANHTPTSHWSQQRYPKPKRAVTRKRESDRLTEREMVLAAVRSLALLRRGAFAKSSALNVFAATGARAFSGNVEYPKIEGSVAEITKNLSNIGARLSIPTAALYLTAPKINHIVREMKGKDELKEVQRVLLLCDAKLVYPSSFASGTFFNACLKLEAPELALEFVRKAENMRHYVENQSFVRLAKYYADQEEQDVVDEIVQIMRSKSIPLTTKSFHFRVTNAKGLNKFDDAVAIAKEAAEARQINSNLILQLLNGLEGDALKEQIPLAKYLAAKGDVIPNARLTQLLADN